MVSFLKKDSKKQKTANQKNWYEDRYQNAVVQRNFLAVIMAVSLVGIIISVLTVIKISSSKTIDPFVIEIEEKTGITTVIRPLLKEQFSYDETLMRYFLTLYMNAREGYTYNSYNYNYYTVVRLYSSPAVYSSFRYWTQSDTNSPLRLGENSSRKIIIKSIAFLNTNTAQIRFTSYDAAGNDRRNERHTIATVTFDYIDMVLTTEERAINPLGFQVTEYRLDEETVN